MIREDNGILLDTVFDEVPAGMELSANGGTAAVSDGSLTLATNSSGSVNSQARFDFGESLTGKIKVSTGIVNNSVSDDTFVNVLFFYAAGTTGFNASTCTSSLAIEKGYLKYHDGSGWRNICAVARGETLNIEVIYDYDNGTMSVTLNGTSVLSGGSLRNTSLKTNVLIFGANKTGLNLSYDYMRIERVTEA